MLAMADAWLMLATQRVKHIEPLLKRPPWDKPHAAGRRAVRALVLPEPVEAQWPVFPFWVRNGHPEDNTNVRFATRKRTWIGTAVMSAKCQSGH